jgi:Cu-Zn family superoxide dismutase
VTRLLLAGWAMLLVAGCAGAMGDKEGAMADKEPLSAEVALKDKDGKDVGRATLVETGEGVRIAVTGYRMPRGTHALHIHAVGRCDPPDFNSAGDHFNPTRKKHGSMSPEGPHAGDLPNLEVAASGEGGVDVTVKTVTLGPGPTSLFGPAGTSLVVHASPDDFKTDPAGNSGARIACGVITR